VADAADASGVMVTVFQLGQVVGVATLGTLYLTRLDGAGAAASASALGWTMLALAGSALVSVVASLTLVRLRNI